MRCERCGRKLKPDEGKVCKRCENWAKEELRKVGEIAKTRRKEMRRCPRCYGLLKHADIIADKATMEPIGDFWYCLAPEHGGCGWSIKKYNYRIRKNAGTGLLQIETWSEAARKFIVLAQWTTESAAKIDLEKWERA